MSSPETTSRRRILALALALPLLAGCSFTPLHGNNSGNQNKGFAYAEPNSRIEQIIYQELAFRLGKDSSPDASLVTISASQANRRVGRTSPGSIMTAYEAVVTANLSVTTRGDTPATPLSMSRFAAASYETSGQIAADNEAANDAGEKAARAVADSLRLILAAARNKGAI
jgi:hypothetical protein